MELTPVAPTGLTPGLNYARFSRARPCECSMECAYHRVAIDTSCQQLFTILPSDMMEEKRKRKGNFTDIEIRKLIELFSDNKNALTAKQSNVNTNKKKQATWRLIMESLKSCSDSGCHRTEADIKKKWKDLRVGPVVRHEL